MLISYKKCVFVENYILGLTAGPGGPINPGLPGFPAEPL